MYNKYLKEAGYGGVAHPVYTDTSTSVINRIGNVDPPKGQMFFEDRVSIQVKTAPGKEEEMISFLKTLEEEDQSTDR